MLNCHLLASVHLYKCLFYVFVVLLERSREAFSAKIEKNIKKKKKNTEDNSNLNEEDEIDSQKKLQRLANFQARSAKNKMKPKKMNAMSDFTKGMLNVFFISLLFFYCYYLFINNIIIIQITVFVVCSKF